MLVLLVFVRPSSSRLHKMKMVVSLVECGCLFCVGCRPSSKPRAPLRAAHYGRPHAIPTAGQTPTIPTLRPNANEIRILEQISRKQRNTRFAPGSRKSSLLPNPFSKICSTTHSTSADFHRCILLIAGQR